MIRDTEPLDGILDSIRRFVNDALIPREREVAETDRDILVAMDWTDFDHDSQSTLVLSLVTGHGRAAPLIWLTVTIRAAMVTAPGGIRKENSGSRWYWPAA